MTQDEIIRMAREAGFEVNYYKSLESEEVVSFDPIITYNLERFAALVAAHEREKLKTPHECQTEGEKTAFAFGWFKATEQIEAAVLAEREACANVVEEMIASVMVKPIPLRDIVAAIRQRGEK